MPTYGTNIDGEVARNLATPGSQTAGVIATAKNIPTYATAHAGVFDGAAAYNVKPSNTARLKAGLGRVAAGTGAGEIAFIGDSLMAGSTTGGGTYQVTSMWPLYMRTLNPVLPAASQSDGMIRFVVSAGTGDPRFAVTGTWLQSGPIFNYATVVNSTVTVTTTTTGTACSIWYYDTADNAQFTISVNGAVSGAGFATVTCSGPGGWRRKDLSGFTAANNVTAKFTVAGSIGWMGILAGGIYNPNTLLFHNIAGASSQASGTGQYSWTDLTGGASMPNAAFVAPHNLAVYRSDPDAVFIGLGVNDLTHGQSQATTIAAVTTLVNSYPNSDVILVITTPLNTIYITNAAWESYAGALYSLADSLGLPLFDFRNLSGNYAAAAASGYTIDGTGHFLPFANAMLGRAVAKALF
jgi:hypothetical protein